MVIDLSKLSYPKQPWFLFVFQFLNGGVGSHHFVGPHSSSPGH